MANRLMVALFYVTLSLLAQWIHQATGQNSRTQQPEDTCRALESLGPQCSTTPSCIEADCVITVSAFGISRAAELTLLPCHEPPAVRVVAHSDESFSSPVELDTIVDRSETVLLAGFEIAVDFQQTATGIGIGLSFSFLTIVPYTEIPLDTSSCTEPPTPSPTLLKPTSVAPQQLPSFSHKPPTSSLPMLPSLSPILPMLPSPSPILPTTCEVLEELAMNPGNSDVDCSTNEACDGIECVANLLNADYQAIALILSCRDPRPAIRLILVDPQSMILFNDTFDNSRNVTIQQLFGLQLSVILQQFPHSIGLQIDAIPPTLVSPDPIPVVQYTIIPIDTTQCEPLTPEGMAPEVMTPDGTESPSANMDSGAVPAAGNAIAMVVALLFTFCL